MNETKEEIQMWKEVAIRFNELYNRGPAALLPTQRMFPNCQKYKKCCTDDKEFWDKVEKLKGEIILMSTPTNKSNYFNKVWQKEHKIPEGFKGW